MNTFIQTQPNRGIGFVGKVSFIGLVGIFGFLGGVAIAGRMIPIFGLDNPTALLNSMIGAMAVTLPVAAWAEFKNKNSRLKGTTLLLAIFGVAGCLSFIAVIGAVYFGQFMH